MNKNGKDNYNNNWKIRVQTRSQKRVKMIKTTVTTTGNRVQT